MVVVHHAFTQANTGKTPFGAVYGRIPSYPSDNSTECRSNLQLTSGLLEARRNIPPGSSCNKCRRDIRRKLNRSLNADREAWLLGKVREMETTSASGTTGELFRLIRAIGPRRPFVSEAVSETDATFIYNKSGRLEQWAEQFEGRVNWLPASTALPPQTCNVVPWSTDLEPPTETEVRNCIAALKRNKAAGPDDLVPALFKEGGEARAREAIKHCVLLSYDHEYSEAISVRERHFGQPHPTEVGEEGAVQLPKGKIRRG
ncbi:uncharacterized protein DEA37_0012800 [Paragonimus westermani]|uniref:Uncharacterized protein n=1 Tax=Paragonimus westermani TaxID=34504 RepID=A0A5J4NHZ9_9TREM|nr:uncharacterized protein DEA37_0012800 [Paragonimus westermani]